MTGAPNSLNLSEAFEAHGIDGRDFGHADHVQVAYELLAKYEFVDAAAIYAKGIKAMAIAAGAPTKSNLTITLAFLSLIAERMADSAAKDFNAFAAVNPDLFSGNALMPHYSSERLYSQRAREIFLLPDKMA